MARTSHMKKCKYCGKEYPDDVIVCAVDQQPLDGMQPEIISDQDKSPSAGFAIRALARIIDTVLGLVVGFVAGILAFIVIAILNTVGIICQDGSIVCMDLA